MEKEDVIAYKTFVKEDHWSGLGLFSMIQKVKRVIHISQNNMYYPFFAIHLYWTPLHFPLVIKVEPKNQKEQKHCKRKWDPP